MASDAQSPPAGQEASPTISQLGPYTLLRQLGEGAMAVVFLAEDTLLQRQVAVKILSPKLIGNPALLARFKREAQAAGKLAHPNIAGAYAVGEERGLHYYVMEYCEGESLDQRLKRAGRFEWYPAVQIARQIAEGLQYAHKLGFIHRDIKPANIMLSHEGTAKILDLGLSKNTQQSGEAGFQTLGIVTIGTPHYISPEQARGEKEIDGRADIYSLGATLYHLVTGSTLFKGDTTAAIIIKHVTDPLPSPADLVPGLPDGLLRVMEKMMARNREDRYADCAQLIQDLDAVLVCGNPVHSGKRSSVPAAPAAPAAPPRPPGGGTTRYADRAVTAPVRRREGKAAGAMDPRVKTAIAGAVVGGVLLLAIAVPLILSRDSDENKPSQQTAQVKPQQTLQSQQAPTLPPPPRTPELPPPLSKKRTESATTTSAPRTESETPPRVLPPPEKAVTPDVVRPRPRSPSQGTRVWESMDIGATGAAGSSSVSDKGFAIKGAGKDIWDNEDSFHFVYLPVKGDAEVVAQVLSLQNTDEWAKAGVMVREKLDATSKHALMTATVANGTALQHRPGTEELSENLPVRGEARAPYWVRLVRTGNSFTGYDSPDGIAWKHANTFSLSMAENAYAGLAVCSHAQGRTTAAEFRNVRVTPLSGRSLPEGCETSDVGSVDLRGGASYEDGAYTLIGSGSDIWESADGFRFLYVRKSGDFDLRARITCVVATDAWAKAGLMVRQSTDAGSVHVTMAVSAENGYFFEQRDRKDAVTDGKSCGTAPFPSAWVRLTREGRTVRGYRAADGAGKQFIQMGAAVTLNATDPVLLGFCLSSHNNEKLSLAEFHDVSGLVGGDSLVGPRESTLPKSSAHSNP